MRKFMAVVPFIAALAACGDSDDPTYIPPKGKVDNPVEFFAMAPCSCFEYAPVDEWEAGADTFSRQLGVAVENISGATRLGRDYHRLTYRIVGGGNEVVRHEYVDPTDPELLVAGINPTGKTNDAVIKLDPAGSLIRVPFEEGDLVTTATKLRFVSPTEDEEGPDDELLAQYQADEEVEIGEWDDIEQTYLRESVAATPISYLGIEGMENGQTRWFVPNRGFVKLRIDLQGERNDWVLVGTRKLDPESCDWDGGPSEPVDQCGTPRSK